MSRHELRGVAGVYAVINKTTGRFYIGSTTDLYKRQTHYASAFKGKGKCNIGLKREVKQYGKESFVFRVLEVVSSLESQDSGFLPALEDAYLNCAAIDVYNFSHRKLLQRNRYRSSQVTVEYRSERSE